MIANFSGQPFGKHSHNAFALGSIVEGVGGYRCKGESHKLPRFTLSLMNPDESHTGYAVSEKLRYQMLYVTEEAIVSLLGTKKLQYFCELTPRDPEYVITRLLTQASGRWLSEEHAGKQLALESDLVELLQTVFAYFGGVDYCKAKAEPAAIRTIKDYLDDLAQQAVRDGVTINYDVSLKELANTVGLHPNYLLQCFSRHVGLPPYAYWMRQRVEVAKRLLAAGQPSVDVATQLGFCDQAHFIRCFRRVTGVTPGSFEVR